MYFVDSYVAPFGGVWFSAFNVSVLKDRSLRSKHRICVTLQLFPKITNVLGTNSGFQSKHCSQTDGINFTTLQLLFGMFSRAFFTRCQEKTLQFLYREGLFFVRTVGLLFPFSLWLLGSSGPDTWPVPCTLWHIFHSLIYMTLSYSPTFIFPSSHFFILFYLYVCLVMHTPKSSRILF